MKQALHPYLHPTQNVLPLITPWPIMVLLLLPNSPHFWLRAKSQEWRNVMAEEYTKNGMWTLVPPVPHANIIDWKYVYKLKRGPEGNISC